MKKKFTTTLDESLIQQMKIQAVKENTSVASLIEKTFKNYMKQN